MSTPRLLHPIKDGANALSLTTERSAVTVTRVRNDATDSGTMMRMEPQDAQLLVFQLNDHPAHDLWLGDKHVPTPPLTSGQMNLIDVSQPAMVRTDGALDSLHVLVPHKALNDLSPVARGQDYQRLLAPDGWMTRDPTIEHLAPMLTHALKAGNLSKLYVDQLVCGLVSHLTETYGVRGDRRPTGGLAPWQVKRAKAMMDETMGRSVSLADIAGACGLSVAHFSRGFRQSVGAAPHAWLQGRRMEKARDLLLDRGKSIADIAAACGFDDHSHFSRIFKREVGMAPQAWRRTLMAA